MKNDGPFGLKAAIEIAGGLRALARQLDVSHQAIRRWTKKIPADRIIAIEAATGVSRSALRPDLYQQPASRPLRKSRPTTTKEAAR
jgi:DNA-binding transcriptional regulator YdaS (Cro superfamily)